MMERLTKRIPVPKEERKVVVFTQGKYSDTIPAEMTHDDIRKVLLKLAEYEDLEEQGLLLRLPCAENTTVYVIEDDCTELSDYCRRKGNCKDCPCRDLHIEPEMFSLSGIVLRLKDFGKTVFLTQSEAEQKLKEMRGVEDGAME